MKEITEAGLKALREQIEGRLSPKRFRHTAAVEEMVARLCAVFCPEQTMLLRAAALLHDVTKELDTDAQILLCEELRLPVSEADRLAPKTFHARTAAALIPLFYPEFDDPTVVSSVRWHTTGHADMTLEEHLLYLADYIDESRTFENCVLLRNFFWKSYKPEMSRGDVEALLLETLLLSYEMTVRDLLAEHAPIATDTMEARNDLLLKKSNGSFLTT